LVPTNRFEEEWRFVGIVFKRDSQGK